MEKQIGHYRLGNATFQLSVSDEIEGAKFNLSDDHGKFVMKVSVNDEWEETYSYLFHEVTEAALTLNGAGYYREPSYSQDNGHFFFAMDHTLFSEAMAQAALTMLVVANPLKKAWKTANREKNVTND